jgi:hypothetical protein
VEDAASGGESTPVPGDAVRPRRPLFLPALTLYGPGIYDSTETKKHATGDDPRALEQDTAHPPLGVTFVPHVAPTPIREDDAALRDVYTGNERQVPADAVVMMVGAEAANEVFHALEPDRANGLDRRLVGDGMAPRRVNDAMREAEIAARAI